MHCLQLWVGKSKQQQRGRCFCFYNWVETKRVAGRSSFTTSATATTTATISGTTTSSTAQGGGGSFKKRNTIGGIGCCESRMSKQKH